MTWLLGLVGVTGIGGVVTLAIYLARMATANRADLQKLIAATKTIGERDRDQAVRIERYKQLEAANEQLQNDLARANAAVEKAKELLMASTGGSGDINDALRLLSEMPTTESFTTAENDHR